jgi:hypothetical protein
VAAVQAVLKVEAAIPVAAAREKVAGDRAVLGPAAAAWDLEGDRTLIAGVNAVTYSTYRGSFSPHSGMSCAEGAGCYDRRYLPKA